MAEVNRSLSFSFSPGLISVFNPSISSRGVLTGTATAVLQDRPRVFVCVCEQQIGIQTADTGAEPAVVHTYARECESLIYSTTWFIESTTSVRLRCSCLPPAPSARLQSHQALKASAPPAVERNHKAHSRAYASIVDHAGARHRCARTTHTGQWRQQWCLMR